jgi:hypothetical protein
MKEFNGRKTLAEVKALEMSVFKALCFFQLFDIELFS